MSEQGVTFYRWTDMPKERVNDTLSRRLVTGDRVMLAHVYVAKGGIVPRHRHENEQITYILEGSLRFWIGEDESEEITLRPGEVLHIPSNVWQCDTQLRCLTNKQRRNITPGRLNSSGPKGSNPN